MAEPQTFLGRVVSRTTNNQALADRADVVSSALGYIPYVGTAVGAMDLGYDLNKYIHGDGGGVLTYC